MIRYLLNPKSRSPGRDPAFGGSADSVAGGPPTRGYLDGRILPQPFSLVKALLHGRAAMERSELDEFLVDLVGPHIDEDLARELDAVRERVRVQWDESSPSSVTLFERTQ